MADKVKVQEEALSYSCDYCEKKVVKKVKCVECGVYFHKSCATRKKCCRNQVIMDENNDLDEEVNSDLLTLIDSLKEEKEQLIEVNKELREVNLLYRQKIDTLESQMKKVSFDVIEELIKNQIGKYLNSGNTAINKNAYQEDISEGKKVNKIPDPKNNKQNQNTLVNDLIDKQTNLMKEIINLSNTVPHSSNKKTTHMDSSKPISYLDIAKKKRPEGKHLNATNTPQKEILTTEDREFTEVRRRRHRKNINLGTHEAENEEGEALRFEAKNKNKDGTRRLWLFIGRAKDHVTPSIVTEYVAKKGKVEASQISVKQLDTNKKISNNKCFLIGMPLQLKDEAYSNNFWPRGIRYERFNFQIGQHFLDKQPPATEPQN